MYINCFSPPHSTSIEALLNEIIYRKLCLIQLANYFRLISSFHFLHICYFLFLLRFSHDFHFCPLLCAKLCFSSVYVLVLHFVFVLMPIQLFYNLCAPALKAIIIIIIILLLLLPFVVATHN